MSDEKSGEEKSMVEVIAPVVISAAKLAAPYLIELVKEHRTKAEERAALEGILDIIKLDIVVLKDEFIDILNQAGLKPCPFVVRTPDEKYQYYKVGQVVGIDPAVKKNLKIGAPVTIVYIDEEVILASQQMAAEKKKKDEEKLAKKKQLGKNAAAVLFPPVLLVDSEARKQVKETAQNVLDKVKKEKNPEKLEEKLEES